MNSHDSLSLNQRQILAAFTADICQRLEQDHSPTGQLLCGHIQRQLDLIDSERYCHWFTECGEAQGFSQAVARAAVAASDVTKGGLSSEIARFHFGTTQEHVVALARSKDLLYGRVFSEFTALENLYMHAEGGRHFAQVELARRGEERLGLLVGEAIVGHDSFNTGFGQHRLKPLLARKYQSSPLVFSYPVSRSPTGFLVQVLDRLEGCHPQTLIRYVTEGVHLHKESIAQAIYNGLMENHAYLCETREQIIQDVQATLHGEQAQVFLSSVVCHDFQRGLAQLHAIQDRFDVSDGVYRLWCGNETPNWVELTSLEVFHECFPKAVELIRSED